mgnify:CR=1 FL=1
MFPSRRSFSAGLGIAAAAALTFAAVAAERANAADTGAPAPAFTGQTATGGTISLSDFAGETVILEWTNHDCPYVRKHYDGEAMQALQARAADEGVTWIQIISSAPGKQGHVSAERALELNEERGAAPAHVILDESGDIGRAYEARTTPHMYLIDEAGVLRYAGAIDDRNSADPASLDGATNYVALAMDAMGEGAEIDPDRTAPYGCSVKY